MPTNISRLVYQFRQLASAAGLPLRPGPAEQLVAAALGYGTLASYQAAVAAGSEPTAMDGAEHLVFDSLLLQERAANLSIPLGELPTMLANAAGDLLAATKVHLSASAFEDYIQDVLAYDAANGEATSGPIAQTNNDGIDEIYLPFDLEFDSIPVGEHHVIEIAGHVSMALDIDRPYSGHRIDAQPTVSFTRTGRASVADFSAGVDRAALDYDW